MKRCKGCGVILQNEDKKKIGYTPKAESDYCQRCFRLIHYDDLTVSMKSGIDPDRVMDEIAAREGTILYVADLFDFEASLIAGLTRKIGARPIVLACTKRDLLPETVSHEKLAQFIFGRLKEYGISVKEVILLSAKKKTGLQELKEALKKQGTDQPVIVMGKANSGKSTLLNALSESAVLTSSRYPGTTLDFNDIEIEGMHFIDTPGIEIQNSMLMAVHEKDLKTLIPVRTVKPTVFQIHEDQSFSIGGLCRIDVFCQSNATVTWYLADTLAPHRSRTARADELWQKQYGKLLMPVPLTDTFRTIRYHINDAKTDVVIDGLGFCCISGGASDVAVKLPNHVNVTFRKAML